jgi:uncharacterized protein YjbJ (UPF0337 family)
MNADRVKGTIDEVVGSAKCKVGGLTGDAKLQVEGAAQQVKGIAENTWGKAKDVLHDAIENTDMHINAHVNLDLKKSPVDIESNKNRNNFKS